MSQLKYEPLNDSHANSLLSIWSDEEVILYTNIKSPCTLEEIRDRIKALEAFDVFIVRKEDVVIGIIGCPCINQEKLQYGLFYQFCKSSWGQGHATESTAWLLNFMREKYQEITLFADAVVDNIASEKILKHFGFELISEEEFNRSGVKSIVNNYRL
jgi:ribosomal-protein-alanine N-acetyltransferase